MGVRYVVEAMSVSQFIEAGGAKTCMPGSYSSDDYCAEVSNGATVACIGPFPPNLVESCLVLIGTYECLMQRWSRATFERVRPSVNHWWYTQAALVCSTHSDPSCLATALANLATANNGAIPTNYSTAYCPCGVPNTDSDRDGTPDCNGAPL